MASRRRWRSTALCPAAYPRVTAACRDAGWEFMVHGYHQMATHLVEDQRAMIRDAIATLREAGGHEPVGWLAPGLTETLDTPDLLAEAGIKYCADWVIDDLPDDDPAQRMGRC